MRRDAARFKSALDKLGMTSQAEAARQSGLSPGLINDVLSNVNAASEARSPRALSREDLRRLQAIDVSADYILGADVPMRLSDRGLDRGTLEKNLAAHVASEALAKAGQEISPQLREEFETKISGSALLQRLIDMAAEDLRDRARFYRESREVLIARATLGVALHRLKRGGRSDLAAEARDALAVLDRRLDAPAPAGRVIAWRPVPNSGR